MTVSSDPPTDLLGLHADRVRIRATDATFRGLRIASLDVTLHDLQFVDRTAGAIDGHLDGVVVPDVGGRDLGLDSIRLAGGGETTIAIDDRSQGADVEALIADAIERKLGARPDLGRAGGARPAHRSRWASRPRAGSSSSSSGDLLVRISNGPAAGQLVPLLRGGVDIPLRLTDATVTPAGDLELTGELAVGLLG